MVCVMGEGDVACARVGQQLARRDIECAHAPAAARQAGDDAIVQLQRQQRQSAQHNTVKRDAASGRHLLAKAEVRYSEQRQVR